jgi:DNA-binding response OmpR family regulator
VLNGARCALDRARRLATAPDPGYSAGVRSLVGRTCVMDPRPSTILVLEDEPGLQRLLARTLTSSGYEVVTAATADEAVAAARPVRLALLVADVNARGASGPVVAQVLKEQQPDLRVLFISGHDPSFLTAHGLTPSAEFLQKPFSPQVFLATVRRLITGTDDDTTAGVRR